MSADHSADPGTQRDPTQVSQFVERLAGLLGETGLPTMASRVFACLLVDDEARLTSAELSSRLRASSAAISGAVRFLISVHMIGREREPGSRRDHYYILNDAWYEVLVSQEELIDKSVALLRHGIQVTGEDTPAGDRLADSLDFYLFMREELPAMAERWHARRAARSAGSAGPDGPR